MRGTNRKLNQTFQEENFQNTISPEEMQTDGFSKNYAEQFQADEFPENYADEMEQLIRGEVLNLKIPEKLKPENMQKVLEASSKTIKAKRRRRFAAAAAILLVIGSGIMLNSNQFLTYGTNSSRLTEQIGSAKLPGDTLQYAGSYETVEAAVKEAQKRYDDSQNREGLLDTVGGFFGNVLDAKNESSMNGAESMDGASSVGGASYSTTNVQVEGVDEADIAKTDGKYIYRLQGDYNNESIPQKLDIISADNGKLKKTGTFTFEREESVTEFYLYKDMAAAIVSGYVTTGANGTEEDGNALQKNTNAADYIPYTDAFTKIIFINMQDKENPVRVNELTQSGYYVQSRLTDGYLYMVTGENAWATGGKANDIWIPCVEHKKVPANQIFIPEGTQNTEFTTIASVDLRDTEKYADSRSILVSSDDFYMSRENIYLYNTKYKTPEKNEKKYTDATEITKFHYSEGKFSGKATGEIAGSIRDSFAIDEYEGRLRVVTSVTHRKRNTITDNIRNILIGYQDTADKRDNAVYILDEGLSVLGSITGIAEDERVYSARFQGNTGYFVTYRETDPLFSVDFSDPKNPKLIGELKIPGFSEYLHFYSDNLLFGIGENGNGRIKLSMFDISDPTNVTEIDKYILKDMDYSEALRNYRSVLIDPEKNIIGFSGEVWIDRNDEPLDIHHYDCFSWKEGKGFTRILKHTFKRGKNQDYGYYGYENSRGIYIKDTLYVVEYYSEHITAYNLKNGKKIGML